MYVSLLCLSWIFETQRHEPGYVVFCILFFLVSRHIFTRKTRAPVHDGIDRSVPFLAYFRTNICSYDRLQPTLFFSSIIMSSFYNWPIKTKEQRARKRVMQKRENKRRQDLLKSRKLPCSNILFLSVVCVKKGTSDYCLQWCKASVSSLPLVLNSVTLS